MLLFTSPVCSRPPLQLFHIASELPKRMSCPPRDDGSAFSAGGAGWVTEHDDERASAVAAQAAPASVSDVELTEPQSPSSVHEWRRKLEADLASQPQPHQQQQQQQWSATAGGPSAAVLAIPEEEADVAGALGAARFESTRVASASAAAAAAAAGTGAAPTPLLPPPPAPQQQHQYQPRPPSASATQPRGPMYAGTGLTPRLPPAGATPRNIYSSSASASYGGGIGGGGGADGASDEADAAALARRDLAWRQVEHWFSTCGWRNISSGEPLEIASEKPSAEALRIVSESLVMDTERGSIMTPSRWNMLMALAESLNVLPAADVVKNPDRRQALAAAMFDLANSIEREEQQKQHGGAAAASAATEGGAGAAAEPPPLIQID